MNLKKNCGDDYANGRQEIAINNNEAVLPKSRSNNAIRLIFNLFLCGFFLIVFLSGAPKNLFDFWLLFFSLLTLYVLISGLNKLSETLVISSKGFNYSTIFEKFEFEWKDNLKIEVITHKQRSEQTGIVISSKTEYIIHTLNGTFTLKEDKAWGRDELTLRAIYDKIISHAPDAEIIQREEEITISESWK